MTAGVCGELTAGSMTDPLSLYSLLGLSSHNKPYG